MKRECIVCGCISEVNSKMIKYVRCIDDPQENLSTKVICPYYKHSEAYPNLYYVLGKDACFKDAYSCCYCIHRIISKEDHDYYCIYEYFDSTKKNMYYLEPIDKNARINKAITAIRFWKCPECNSIHELSHKETICQYDIQE